jgi:hypothetical protein
MSRLNLTFAEAAPPEPRTWTLRRILVWALLFASLTLWVDAALMR